MVQKCKCNYHNLLFAVDNSSFIDIQGRLSLWLSLLHCCLLSCSNLMVTYIIPQLSLSNFFSACTVVYSPFSIVVLSKQCYYLLLVIQIFTIVLLIFIRCLEFLFFLSDKHNYIDLLYLVYLILLHVLAVQMSHRQVGHEYTKTVKGRSLSWQTLCKTWL